MKTNNLNRCLLSIAVTTALTACGPDDGFEYENSAVQPISMDSNSINVSITETHDENDANRYQTIDLLQGISNKDVFILDIQKQSLMVQPGDRVSDINEEAQKPVLVSGTNLLVDTYQFASLINTGESFEYSINYWVDNGYDFTCSDMNKHPANCTAEEILANPNRRSLTLTVNALPDPITGIDLSNFSVGLNDTMSIPVQAVPSYAADANFSWEIVGAQDIISIGDNNQITGIKLGTTQIKVTSQVNSSLTKTVEVSVTNPPKNVAEIKATNLNNGDLPSSILLTDCTQFDLKVMAEKLDANQDLTGEFVYSVMSETAAFSVDGFTPNTGPEQSGNLTVNNFGTNDTLTISLNGLVQDPITLPVTTAENIACNYADLNPAGEGLLNEDFTVYHSKGTIPAFVISSFIRNGEGDDVNLDLTATTNVVGTGGKNDSGALHYTADGTAKGGINSYHKNATRYVTPDIGKDGGKYVLSFWAKNHNDQSVTLGQYISASNNSASAVPVAGAFGQAEYTFESSQILSGSSNWQQFSIEIEMQALPAGYIGPKWEITITPNQTDGSTPIDILFDDFSISKITD